MEVVLALRRVAVGVFYSLSRQDTVIWILKFQMSILLYKQFLYPDQIKRDKPNDNYFDNCDWLILLMNNSSFDLNEWK